MVTFPVQPLTGLTFLNLFGLVECLVMWLISMPEIKSLTAKLLQQGYRYHKLRKTISKFYRRHYELVSKFSVGLKTLLHQGLSEPEFYVTRLSLGKRELVCVLPVHLFVCFVRVSFLSFFS